MVAAWLLLALITPLSQFLTIMAVNASVETDSPVGWALGLVISIALAGAVVRVLARRGFVGRSNLAFLYTMLALGVPLMNIGLVRQYFLASHMVIREYMYEGTSTYRTAYNVLNDRWFPVVPTREGMAWSRSDRVLRLLDDPGARQRQSLARRALEAADFPDLSVLSHLSLDDAASFLSRNDPEELGRSGLLGPLQQRVAEAAGESAAAREFLAAQLDARDEWAASLLSSNREKAGYSNLERLEAEVDRLDAAGLDALRQRTAELTAIEDRVRAAVAALGESDRRDLLAGLRARELGRLAELGRDGFQSERNSYVFRLNRDERRDILRMNGSNGPNQNLFAFFTTGIWNTPQEKSAMEAMGFSERIAAVFQAIPWSLYLVPVLCWGFLFTSIFAFLMCLAEWLRRKWVSRENLPFPLVEVADYVIRHDYRLETAGDLVNPGQRVRLFYPLFLIGCGIGFLMLFLQGMGHYGLMNNAAVIKFDFTRNIFDVMGGALKNLPETVFILSPIVVGIVFLLSLEIGFSIWFSFILYAVGVFLVKAVNPTLMDSNWTGYADGKLYPFTMEQLLGACLCFACYHLWKVRNLGKQGSVDEGRGYLPDLATKAGLLVFPFVILGLFWDIGVKSVPMLLIYSAAILVITVSLARVRAETGFPLNHAVFEFTKLPIILGLTGTMGAKAYAAFLNVVFLPTTLLFRTLPQQLENMELARRYRIGLRSLAAGAFSSVLVVLAAGFFSFLMFAYFMGDTFYGLQVLQPQNQGNYTAVGVAHYPLWVGHFLGEPGLDRFTEVNWFRVSAILAGFGAVGVLLFLRQKFLRFPLHPVGYLVLLMTILYSYETPYIRVPVDKPLLTSTIWGSALVAWLVKRLLVKYGGMTVYKRTKPLFVGLIVGSVAAIFLWNMVDLAVSLYATGDVAQSDFIRAFAEKTPFIPVFN